jgi:hypothetical protein
LAFFWLTVVITTPLLCRDRSEPHELEKQNDCHALSLETRSPSEFHSTTDLLSLGPSSSSSHPYVYPPDGHANANTGNNNCTRPRLSLRMPVFAFADRAGDAVYSTPRSRSRSRSRSHSREEDSVLDLESRNGNGGGSGSGNGIGSGIGSERSSGSTSWTTSIAASASANINDICEDDGHQRTRQLHDHEHMAGVSHQPIGMETGAEEMTLTFGTVAPAPIPIYGNSHVDIKEDVRADGDSGGGGGGSAGFNHDDETNDTRRPQVRSFVRVHHAAERDLDLLSILTAITRLMPASTSASKKSQRIH